MKGIAQRSTQNVEYETICVLGLGYVGLPLAIAFDGVGHEVIGFDISDDKIDTLAGGHDPTNELGDDAIDVCEVAFTTDASMIATADYILVAVPTPIDDLKKPDLKHVVDAAEVVGAHLTAGSTVVLESTVYPGATRNVFTPTLEAVSGLDAGSDFFVGYSPERLVPGDPDRSLETVAKIVSGQTDAVCQDLAALYGTIVDAEIHRAPSMEAAEAAKCIENIQRDLNIALVNEFAIACNTLGIDTKAVLEAAATKWNFHAYRPGLVGGHCIPVDPFFMIYESERNGFSPRLIEQAREVNEYMPKYIGEMTIKGINDCGKVLMGSTALVLGLAYKPNVADVRTSSVGGIINHLREYGVDVRAYDPHVDASDAAAEFDIEVQPELVFADVDVAILSTPHDDFLRIDFAEAAHEMATNPLVVDVMGALDADELEAADHLSYWRV